MFWQRLGNFILKFRLILSLLVISIICVFAYWAKNVKLSYELTKAIPTNHPKYIEYKEFQKVFGDDGNLVVVGFKTDSFFKKDFFNTVNQLGKKLKSLPDVNEILYVPQAITLANDVLNEKINSVNIFPDTVTEQSVLDESAKIFKNLPFYKSLMYNPNTNAYLIGIKVNKDSINSPKRSLIVDSLKSIVNQFSKQTNIKTHISGLPLIRSEVATKIKSEMEFLLKASLILSAILLLLFFRSIGTTVLSLVVVLMSVVFSFGLMHLFGYNITLLTALIPPLVVVIGIPNCIYFVNKYHASILNGVEKMQALKDMIGKMGIITLFCNITAAIGFFVFAFTKSTLLKEFGWVAGISILMIFFISLIILPAGLSILPKPKAFQISYLKSKFTTAWLNVLNKLVFKYTYWVLGAFLLLTALTFLGINKLQSKTYMLDDIPKTDKLYEDLHFFEENFKGIMPLEIIIDAKKPKLLSGSKALSVFSKIDSFSNSLQNFTFINRPLSIAEGLKFAKQGIYFGDTLNYALPNETEAMVILPNLRVKKDSTGKTTGLSKILNSFIDSAKQRTRISIGMADVGTVVLDSALPQIKKNAEQFFPKQEFDVKLTGTSVTFLEGSKFIINGLKESILWAFGLISVCMLFLFRNVKILFASLIPNLIPLLFTAGVMGWMGVPIKPSTVLVFSIAFGIAIDITIRFLIFYKQEQNTYTDNELIKQTVYQTGPSILFTSLVLVGGFVVFCKSNFGGTFALGWLTSFTLLVATFTNLTLLPILLKLLKPKQAQKHNTPTAQT